MKPAYLTALENGTLDAIAQEANQMLQSCAICPRKCKVNRLRNELGFCKTGLKPKVYSFLAHHGEEPPISGMHGSGTIFFSNCNMRCVYCQNYEFSQLEEGKEMDIEELAVIMLRLQKMKCHNINVVTPTHIMPQILAALAIAARDGLSIPLVYNTSGYELPEIIKKLDGLIDVYLPDMRYADDTVAAKYSQAPGYPALNQATVKEMHRQVGIARMNKEDIIEKGIIIRHLVLPNALSGTDTIMKFIARELSPDTYISLMSQYFPCYEAKKFPELSRRISAEEYQAAIDAMHHHGLSNGWVQEEGGLERFAGIHIEPNVEN